MEITVTKNYFPYTGEDSACTAGVAEGPKRLYDDGPKSVAISVPNNNNGNSVLYARV